MLRLCPVTLREANAYVAALHRHSGTVRGCLFCVGAEDGESLRGVAIVGRPLARPLQDGYTAEVLRVCTDGARNAPSMLYGAAWRGVRAIGYTRLVTYTLQDEAGSSLRAVGWRPARLLPSRPGWDGPGRSRDNTLYRASPRVRWEVGEPAGRERPPLELPEAADPQLAL
jgi:hypothetical protein